MLNPIPSRASALASLSLCLALPATALAAQGNTQGSEPATRQEVQSKVRVVFSHLELNRDAAYTISVADGDEFAVLIQKTLPDQFNYEIGGILAAPDSGVEAASGAREDQLGAKTLTRLHDKKFAGYLVRITKKRAGEPAEVIRADQSKVDLNAVTLLIAVATRQWHAEVSGGFTGSGLIDPVFAIQTRDDGDGEQKFVIEDPEARDKAALGLASFVHVYHDKLPWLGGTFGLGITSSNRTTYYLGPSIRLGNAAALTAGYAWGSVARLPAGVAVNQPPPDDSVLSNLGTKIEHAFFVGVSFTFIKAEDKILKPFAGAVNAAGSQ